MQRHPGLGALAVVLGLLPTMAQGAFPDGIGALGDSYTDEYQFYPPDRTCARNWLELLAATRGLNFGPFSTVDRGEPRNQGYEYNWSRSDATTADMIRTGQHTGLAAQVARGDVRLVWVFIGGNDFINALHSPNPRAALEGLLPRVQANHRLALETILAASPEVRVVVGTVPDIRHLPEFDRLVRAGRLDRATIDAYSTAIGLFNRQIMVRALTDRRIALVDLALTVKVGAYLNPAYVTLAGVKLDRLHSGNTVDHCFVGDDRHLGTIAQGQLAQLFLNAVNAKFGAGIAPLTDREVIEFALGLAPTTSPAIDQALARLKPVPTPALVTGTMP